MTSRRTFMLGTALAGGGLVLGWSLLPPRQRLHTTQPLPLASGQVAFNGWLKVGSDDRVTVMVPKSEMGQGVLTALAMIAAEELDADWDRVAVEHPPVDDIYNNIAVAVDGLPFHPDQKHSRLRRAADWMTAKTMREIGVMATGGSTSVKDLWLPLREAGASARAMLVAAAAQAWQLPATEILVREGRLSHPAGRQARFGELAAAAAALPVPERVALKSPEQFTLLGKPRARLDSPSKVDGSAVFGIDVRPPGLLFAAVQMCPVLGGRVSRFDGAAIQALPGVKKVLALAPHHGGSGGVAVVASHSWLAKQAVEQLRPVWDEGPLASLGSAELAQRLKQTLEADSGFAYFKAGDVDAAFAGAARTLSAEYSAPLLAHSTMEPMNCTVLFEPEAQRATVWAPTQVPGLARKAAARVLGLKPAQVQMHVTLLGGGFGRRLEVDFVAQAAEVALALPGTPVQTLWSREQDLQHDFYRPACVARLSAALDAQGRVLGFRSHSAGQAIVHQVMKRTFGLPAGGPDKTTAEGAFDQPYEWPAARVSHAVLDLPLQVGFWRSVGHSHQAFFKECFVDELAAAARQDPVVFRSELLRQHPRQRAALQRCAALAGWGQPLPPAADGAKQAQGVALHESFGSTVAMVVQASVAADKTLRVHQVFVVVDCGFVVNPAGVRAQVESAVVYGLSAALHGEVRLDKGRVQHSNFHDQPVLRMNECPVVSTEIMASDLSPEGMGEPATPPLAPALANAVFALTGQRLRALPLKLA